MLEDRFIDVNGVRTRYWDAGPTAQAGHAAPSGQAGAPVILLHGIACSVHEWAPNIEPLARQHRVIAVDLPGCGLSAKPGERQYTIDEYARFVFDLMTALRFEQAHLAGNSLGGRIALTCAMQSPAKVLSNVLVAPAGVGYDTIINFRLASVPLLGELLTKPNRMGLRMLWRTAVYDPSLITEQLVSDKVRDAAQPGAQSAFLKCLRSFVGFSGFERGQVDRLHAALPAMKTPTLVCWGRQDKFLSVAHAQILQRLLPDVQVQIYEQCGHMPQIEHAVRFNDAALAYWAGLTRRGTASPARSAIA